jgi:hypothetical protein
METRTTNNNSNKNLKLFDLLQNDFELYKNYLSVYENIDVYAYNMLINRHEFKPSNEALNNFKKYLKDNNLKFDDVSSKDFKFNQYLNILKKEAQKPTGPRIIRKKDLMNLLF